MAVTAQVLLQQAGPPYAMSDLAPSTSLTAVRCEALRSARPNDPCIDAATLQHFWPDVSQAPNIVYVGLTALCASFAPSGLFSVEYMPSSRSMVMHCLSTGPWLPLGRQPMGALRMTAEPLTDLVLLPTDGIKPGKLTIIEDQRVEHLIGDDSTETVLGTVSIT